MCLIYVACVKSRYSLKGSTYHYSYQDNGSMKLTDQEDTYLRTTTTRVRKPDPPESTGSHGGGGGGKRRSHLFQRHQPWGRRRTFLKA